MLAEPDLRLLAPSAGYDPLRATAGVYIEQWMNQLGIPVEAQLMNFNRILEIKEKSTSSATRDRDGDERISEVRAADRK